MAIAVSASMTAEECDTAVQRRSSQVVHTALHFEMITESCRYVDEHVAERAVSRPANVQDLYQKTG